MNRLHLDTMLEIYYLISENIDTYFCDDIGKKERAPDGRYASL